MDTSIQDTARWEIWCSRIPGYVEMDKNEKKRAKKEWNNMYTFNVYRPDFIEGTFTTTCNVQQPEEENPMDAITITKDSTIEQRRHLEHRLYQIYSQKSRDAEKDIFFTRDDDTPRTGKELIERVTAGKFEYDEDAEKKYKERGGWIDGPFQFIRWRDPSKKADAEGYKTWGKKLEKAYDSARDEIKIYDPEKGLETLRKFESDTIN